MNFHILTLFPDMVVDALNTGILGKAVAKGIIGLDGVDIRDFSHNRHRKVDDYTYGGGAGLLMQAQPIYEAVQSVQERLPKKARVIYMTPQGRVFHAGDGFRVFKERTT
jgi:tRNA (guanine37-N1)-methyltransferase